MPRGFGISNYMTLNFGKGHQAPPWEILASVLKCNPIPVLRLSQKIDEYEAEHKKPVPLGQIIALAKVQGLEPNQEQVQALLNARKEWRGHRALAEPGEAEPIEGELPSP